ncbi:uncharacterized protein THITE_2118995 [Thermothielavioides terrestris NRRL 8126]|uniref:Hyaluronan/mRNA-binding protein domain-containing protein n=1 Tax=Thermothielavioides terrestris (strain ATCC 38088 / NRRL 8126) TaxID=578455 RepID=G2RB50_THETT|nr:uncharacterized protein THITE_2118995 [Thermothielavioides terrestris NRRL 8126]AEO69021.1 hypothetical protein THITE_2118995 [Thermothielavioides terrestris NRRL 8126]
MAVPTKNTFAIFAELGNDEGDEIPTIPVKAVEKTSTHTAKRNTDGLAPTKAPASGGNRRGGAAVGGNEAAFRDRNAGRESNRGKPTDEAPRGGRRGGFRGRGGRREEGGDRHPTRSAPHNSEKQAAQSWGANEGKAELKDEQAAEEIAQTEQKEGEAAPEAEAKEEEPQEKHLTYDQYLAQLAEKKLALEAEAALKVRKPNEGVKDDKWKDFAPLTKKDDEEELFAGSGGKTKRERERKTKQFVELDNRYIEPERTRGGRGGRGGARGDAGRGRGRGGPRGEFRGGRGRGGENQPPLNTNDQDAFPSLGSAKA